MLENKLGDTDILIIISEVQKHCSMEHDASAGASGGSRPAGKVGGALRMGENHCPAHPGSSPPRTLGAADVAATQPGTFCWGLDQPQADFSPLSRLGSFPGAQTLKNLPAM